MNHKDYPNLLFYILFLIKKIFGCGKENLQRKASELHNKTYYSSHSG